MKPLLVHVARVIVILWCFRAGAQHVRAVKVVTEVYTTSVTIEPPGFGPYELPLWADLLSWTAGCVC